MSLAAWLNAAWMWKCRPELHAWERATRNVAAAQWGVLKQIVADNRDTAFGRQYGFGSIRSASDLQARLPLANYADLSPYIDRMAAGESNVLTRERTTLFEPTSGSTGGEKLIPYNRAVRQQFQRGISAWIADLFAHRPAVRAGRAYWSISPAFGERRHTSGGIPIGFDNDAAYLGMFEQYALRKLLAVSPEVVKLDSIQAFRYVTLLQLLAADDLALVSIWSPSFLPRLFDGLDEWSEKICHDLQRGVRFAGGPSVSSNPRRANEITAILRSTRDNSERMRQLWPKLAMISCWTDAAASVPLAELRTLFPHVEIQPKGLLATECFVSLPLTNEAAPALAVRSHFFEFLPAEDPSTTRTQLAHELVCGQRYRVIVTTGGGLYRYQLNDEIEVVAFRRECPLIRFVGKSDQTCDLAGEKLAEPHARQSLEYLLASRKLTLRFALLAPMQTAPPRYRLFLQLDADRIDSRMAVSLATELQAAFEANPHYRYAIQLGQLSSLDVAFLDPAAPAGHLFEQTCLGRGQRLGNIKPMLLDRWPGWGNVYNPITKFIVESATTTPQTNA